MTTLSQSLPATRAEQQAANDLLADVLSAIQGAADVTPDGAAVAVTGAMTVVAASGTPRAVALYNRGGDGAGDYVTYRVAADASGADTERRIYVGQRVVLSNGNRFTGKVSVFAPIPTHIEWETWA